MASAAILTFVKKDVHFEKLFLAMKLPLGVTHFSFEKNLTTAVLVYVDDKI